jgi:hypothetical protein
LETTPCRRGADETAVQRTATHSHVAMTRNYDRRVKAAVTEVAEGRRRSRKKGEANGV